MVAEKEFDFLIVGQGLAGSCLAMHLLEAGRSICIVDNQDPHRSSSVAAGLYNPITGRKMVKTWLADALFPYLIEFYKKFEIKTNGSFLKETPIYRPFLSINEQNDWMGKSISGESNNFIEKIHTKSRDAIFRDPYGGIELKKSGVLDVNSFLSCVTAFLVSQQILMKGKFDPMALLPGKEYVTYQDYKATKVIFCDGAALTENPYFNWLPLSPVKGEIVEIESDMALDYILNRGIFLIPMGKGKYKVGSTYEHNDLSIQPTQKGRLQIEEKLKELIQADYKIIKQYAGVRPATKDRRPFIGLHPEFETIGVFNGLGTKGVSLAPYFSNQFVNYLIAGQKLNEEVNISRYFSLYSILSKS